MHIHINLWEVAKYATGALLIYLVSKRPKVSPL